MTEMLYNLIIRADESKPMPVDRMLERTDDDIKNSFMPGAVPDFSRLAQYPTIMTKEFFEEDITAKAVIGYMDTPSINPYISNPIMTFPSVALLAQGILTRWGGSRTCWMVLRGDPFRLFYGVNTSPSRHGKAEKLAINDHLISVMMPFTDDATIDPVYKAIERGSADARFGCKRVDQFVTPADISVEICQLISSSYAVIADISGINPNVMYELGFAHGKGKSVILVSSDSSKDLPFDIGHQRVLFYRKDESGLTDLSNKIAKAISSLVLV